MSEANSENMDLKRLLVMMEISNSSLKAKRLQLISMHQRRRKLVRVISTLMQSIKKNRRPRKMWMKKRYGKFWELDVPNNSEEFFKERFRMSRKCFLILCRDLQSIAKSDTNFRLCIPLEKRIAIALYTLASSAEYTRIGRLFGVSKTSVCRILRNFCNEVWTVLAPKYLRSNFLTEEKIKECVDGFKELGFPQCVFAFDGCHIEIQPAKEDASDYINYKGWYSMVLLALVDYRFKNDNDNTNNVWLQNPQRYESESNLHQPETTSSFIDNVSAENIRNAIANMLVFEQLASNDTGDGIGEEGDTEENIGDGIGEEGDTAENIGDERIS